MDYFTWTYLDRLPKIPQDILGDLDQYKKNPLYTEWQTYWADQPWQEKYIDEKDWDPREYYNFKVHGKLLTWLKYNITDMAKNYGLVYYGVMEGTGGRRPHIDQSRNFLLLYIIDPGGDQVTTTFYHAEGFPVMPGNLKEKWLEHKLNKIDNPVWETGRWVLMNPKIIHAVDNMTRMRISMQLCLMENPFVTGQCK